MNTTPLATWTYTQEEWNEYVQLEKSNKKEDNIYFGIGIVILGTVGLMFFRGTSFCTGLLFSIPIAILIPLFRMKFSYKHLKKGISNPAIVFYPDHIDVNGSKIELISFRKRIKSAKIIDVEGSDRHLLELNIQWLTGKGPTNDEFRFLIPKDRYNEAEKLINGF